MDTKTLAVLLIVASAVPCRSQLSPEGLRGSGSSFEKALAAGRSRVFEVPDEEGVRKTLSAANLKAARVEAAFGAFSQTVTDIRTQIGIMSKDPSQQQACRERLESLFTFMKDALADESERAAWVMEAALHLGFHIRPPYSAEVDSGVKTLNERAVRLEAAGKVLKSDSEALQKDIDALGSAAGGRVAWLSRRMVEDAGGMDAILAELKTQAAKLLPVPKTAH